MPTLPESEGTGQDSSTDAPQAHLAGRKTTGINTFESYIMILENGR